jgi:hypothetical protein
MKIKKFLLFILPIVVLGLLVLWPSFKLDLTGDDYLGLWRYHFYLDGRHGGNWNNLNYFLTDYGPQDTITAIIHSFVGFQARYYYIVSFIFRMLAAFSFFPLIKYLTKNSKAAYLSSLFFAITTTGLEATDWSFNMPSYLAIALLNIFLLTYLKLRNKYSHKLLIPLALLFYLAIIIQPIRMTFLPEFMIVLELYTMIIHRTVTFTKRSLLRIGLYIGIFIYIYITGYIGNVSGAGETFTLRLNGGWIKVLGGFSSLVPHLLKGEFSLFAYPIAQFGNIIFPSLIIPPGLEAVNPMKAILKVFIPSCFIFSGLILLYKSKKSLTIGSIAATVLWCIYIFFSFIFNKQTLFNRNQVIAILVGGFMTIYCAFLFLRYAKNADYKFGIFLSIVLIFLSFSTYWLKYPLTIFESTGRYMIVPAAGLTILLGVLLGFANKTRERLAIYCIFTLLFFINLHSSYSFLYHISTVREISLTEKIRNSIPNIKNFNNPDVPLVFYFEPKDSEILHHSIIFGFPVIMGDKYHFVNVWHFAYTDQWNEVVSAAKDGSSLKRFGIPVKKVTLDNIYSFKLKGDDLINTTAQTRNTLKQMLVENK